MVMGRPPKPENERRNQKINFRLSDETMQKLDECKAALNCDSRSEVIVQAIDKLHEDVTANK